MARTYAETVTEISAFLQDSSNIIYSTAEVKMAIKQAVETVSMAIPRLTKETLATTASKDLTLTTEMKRNLLWIDRVEYLVAQTVPSYHNVIRWGDTVTMLLDITPVASQSVYMYLCKKHIFDELGTTDTAGDVSATTAAGLSLLPLKTLGTGTINENSTLLIAGDATVYTVTAQATIEGTAATVAITPVLAAQATVEADVTLSAPASTLEVLLEEPLISLAASICALSKAAGEIGQSQMMGNSFREYRQYWMDNRDAAMRELNAIAPPRTSYLYSRS